MATFKNTTHERVINRTINKVVLMELMEHLDEISDEIFDQVAENAIKFDDLPRFVEHIMGHVFSGVLTNLEKNIGRAVVTFDEEMLSLD